MTLYYISRYNEEQVLLTWQYQSNKSISLEEKESSKGSKSDEDSNVCEEVAGGSGFCS
jgi:hypothetical protein